MNEKIKPILRTGPVVCAVDRYYLIMVPVNTEVLMSIIVNGKEYFDHVNGVKRTDTPVQRFLIPMEELDSAREYTLCYRRVISRQAYSCLKGHLITKKYSFRPVKKKDDINICLISDCHGIKKEAIMTAGYFGDDLNLLILNGDISSSCMTINEAMLPFEIAFGVTQGEIPCVITRGNHDLRGKYSEKLDELMPSFNGKMYYEVCLGALWLLVLDCGEDKNDDHREYGGTAAFHAMRTEETRFIKNLCMDDKACFRSDDIKYRLVVSHVPFVYRDKSSCRGECPFNIEEETYSEWTRLLNENIHPHLCLAGHVHRCSVWTTDSEKNGRGIECPVITAGVPSNGKDRNVDGAGITLRDGTASVVFTDKQHQIKASEKIGF